ncbi:MAG: restriction endonuclease [Mariniphaga sp.]|nr:restriction endonuclease [Mariniphaga sp.]
MNISVVKRDGERVLFNPEKLKQALQSAGAGPDEQKIITERVTQKLYDGIPTGKIYKMAFDLLKRESFKMAARYKLKKAIMELGPTGFPFEKFVGKILESMEYTVETGVIIQGKCVQHEVDVVARKPGEMLMIECKFHSDYQKNSSVQVPLYIQSRFLDVKASWEKQYGHDIRYRGGVVTNTRFSDDAVKYGICAGLLVISWDYPVGNGLKHLIDKTGLHPLTSMISLTKAQKHWLLEKGIVLCSELAKNQGLLQEMEIPERQRIKILREAESLIQE